MLNMGPQEVVFIFLIVLLLFGGKKIPEIARGLGKGVREFKKGVNGVREDMQSASTQDQQPGDDGDSSPDEPPAIPAVGHDGATGGDG